MADEVRLPALIDRARSHLADARTSAEVLEARPQPRRRCITPSGKKRQTQRRLAKSPIWAHVTEEETPWIG